MFRLISFSLIPSSYFVICCLIRIIISFLRIFHLLTFHDAQYFLLLQILLLLMLSRIQRRRLWLRPIMPWRRRIFLRKWWRMQVSTTCPSHSVHSSFAPSQMPLLFVIHISWSWLLLVSAIIHDLIHFGRARNLKWKWCCARDTQEGNNVRISKWI